MYFVDPADIQTLFQSTPSQHYESIFSPSSGAGMPFFQGTYTQKGQGLLGDLIRDYALPLLKKAAPHILKGVHSFVTDLRRGRNVKEAGKTALRRTARNVLTGRGKKRKKATAKKKRTATATKKRKTTKRKKPVKKRVKKKSVSFALFK